MLVRESYGEDNAETKTERSDKSEESEYGGSFIDDDDPEFVSSSQEFSGEGRRKKKYQISESENEGSSQQMDFTSGIAATVEVLDNNHNDNEIEDDATMLEGTNAVRGVELECEVGTEDGAKLKRKRKEHFEDNVTKEDEVQKSGSNLNTVTEDEEGNKRKCKDKEGDAMKMEPPSLPANEKKITVVEMDAKDANDKEIQLSNGFYH
ncbi:hypothetical protein Gorai_000679 [Gossypium raimondii]|uniref:Uncharacterized protein n=1 Tax=Gossypium raimondii TaxID=29730 RepID=A0A7J8PEG0_GOSRA|nr:hypothetical protein [Gossypium raimondii]